MTHFDSLRRFKEADFTPRPCNSHNWRKVKRVELYQLLKMPYKRKWYCWHSWVYWKFGEATRTHRVCESCHKKQTNQDVLGHSSGWVEDISVKKLHNYISKLNDTNT